MFSGSPTVHLFGVTLSLGPAGAAAVVGWVLFAIGALLAVHRRVSGREILGAPSLVGAGVTLALMSGGLGLLLGESYPTFARMFCLPYALLALAGAIFGHAMQAAGRPIGEE